MDLFPIPGAVMMRPYLGAEIPFGVGINEPGENSSDIDMFPNPVRDVLHVKSQSANSFNLEVLDYTGKILFTEYNSSTVDVSHLTAGFIS
jgi:hypothetical protein